MQNSTQNIDIPSNFYALNLIFGGMIEKIKEIRNRKNLSQADMARLLGFGDDDYARVKYTRIEGGKTELTVEMLQKIAVILEVPVASFFPAPSSIEELNLIFKFWFD